MRTVEQYIQAAKEQGMGDIQIKEITSHVHRTNWIASHLLKVDNEPVVISDLVNGAPIAIAILDGDHAISLINALEDAIAAGWFDEATLDPAVDS